MHVHTLTHTIVHTHRSQVPTTEEEQTESTPVTRNKRHTHLTTNTSNNTNNTNTNSSSSSSKVGAIGKAGGEGAEVLRTSKEGRGRSVWVVSVGMEVCMVAEKEVHTEKVVCIERELLCIERVVCIERVGMVGTEVREKEEKEKEGVREGIRTGQKVAGFVGAAGMKGDRGEEAIEVYQMIGTHHHRVARRTGEGIGTHHKHNRVVTQRREVGLEDERGASSNSNSSNRGRTQSMGERTQVRLFVLLFTGIVCSQ